MPFSFFFKRNIISIKLKTPTESIGMKSYELNLFLVVTTQTLTADIALYKYNKFNDEVSKIKLSYQKKKKRKIVIE